MNLVVKEVTDSSFPSVLKQIDAEAMPQSWEGLAEDGFKFYVLYAGGDPASAVAAKGTADTWYLGELYTGQMYRRTYYSVALLYSLFTGCTQMNVPTGSKPTVSSVDGNIKIQGFAPWELQGYWKRLGASVEPRGDECHFVLPQASFMRYLAISPYAQKTSVFGG